MPISGRPPLTCLLVVAAVAGLAAASVKVNTEYDRSAVFGALHSYRWLPTPPYIHHVAPEARESRYSEDTLDPQIRAAVDKALASRGLAIATEPADPDCFLVYYAAFGINMNDSVLGEYYGYLTGWGSPFLGATPTTSLRVIEEGTLVVDVVTRDKKTAIWRGKATGAIDRSRTSEQRLRTIDEAVRKMFARFPPGR